MNTLDLIERKREGGRFTVDEISWLIGAYVEGDIPDYQMGALLMAVYFRGLDAAELATWTEAMIGSGEVLDLSHVTAPKVDKHSTGGVGDKVSIALVPMVAACGVAVPMMSGRGLGHTGGTLDKLESIPGFSTDLDPVRFTAQLTEIGLVLAGPSATLVPADRRIYALRDATGTVPSVPLIASSVMSKKLAEDLNGLVLDIKVGRGAFMKDEASARELAETMVGVGRAHDTDVVAILTAMDEPLGAEVGNANEVAEAIAVLRGEGPADLTEVVLRLGEEMLLLGGISGDQTEARARLEDAVESGASLDAFRRVVEAQGGDPAVVDDPGLLPAPANVNEVPAHGAGHVVTCDALDIGRAAVRLGAGRATKEDDVDPSVGITVLAKRGDHVEEGQPLARVGWRESGRFAAAMELLAGAWSIGDEPPAPAPLIIGDVR